MELPALTLASRITLARIAGIPVYALLLVAGQRAAATLLFVVILSTDALDGWLARRRGEVSDLGRVLDPLADKLLMACSIVLLARNGFAPRFPLWLAGLVARELFLGAGYLVIRRARGRVEVLARPSGKAATLLIGALVFALLLPTPAGVITVLTTLTATAFVWSWLEYLRDGMKQLRRAG